MAFRPPGLPTKRFRLTPRRMATSGPPSWKWAIGLVILAIVAAISCIDHRGGLLYQSDDDSSAYHRKRFRVTHVVDGDTLDIDQPDAKKGKRTTRIRLWGVNAPEIAHPQFGKTQDQPYGPQAAAFAKQLALNQQVYLELEPGHSRDSFDRLLAYVQLPDGRWLNEELIRQGLAKADNRPGDKRFFHHLMDRYAQLETEARQAHRGLWSDSSSNVPAP